MINPIERFFMYLKISRPRYWVDTILTYIVGYLLGTKSFTWQLVIGAIYFSFFYNFMLYGIKEIFDSQHTKHLRKLHAQIEKKYLIIAVALLNIPFLTYLFINANGIARIIIFAMILAALFYSLPNLRFRDKPILDVITRSSHFVLPFVLGLAMADTDKWYVAGLVAFALWTLGSYCLASTQTIGLKRAASTSSIATFLGVRKTVLLSFWCYLLSSILIAVFYWPNGLIAALLLTAFTLNSSFFLKYKSDAKAKLFARAWRNFVNLHFVIGFWIILLLTYSTDTFGLGDARVELLAKFFILFGGAQILLIIHNLVGFRRPQNQHFEEYPKLSILIHAYNQADNIASTLLAVLGQNYPDFEILFTDLGSDDNTLRIAETYQDPKMTIKRITPLPDDWTINSWASQQLYEKSSGDIVVVVSADTVLLPDTIGRLVGLMIEQKLDVVSLLPADQNKTIAQKLLLATNRFFWFGMYPTAYFMKNRPQLSTAYSGLMAFQKAALDSINGFELVKRSPLEDLDLVLAAKGHGKRSAFYLASDLAIMQNHASLRLIILQNIQRYYPSMRYNFAFSIGIITIGIFTLCMPTILFVRALFANNTALAILFGIGIAMIIINRIIIAVTSRQSYATSLLYPLTSAISFVLMLLSILQYELLKPRWKNRTEV